MAKDSCLTCSKRQVRCDGARPTCTRCPNDGRTCRGYKDQLRIVQVDPKKKHRAHPQKTIKATETATPYKLCLPRSIFVGDRDLWTIADCTRYWNAYVIPSTFPAERPFFRVSVSANDIAEQPLPKVCLHMVIVAFRSTQAATSFIDPLKQQDLCYYRGLALRELPEHLENAATDPWGIALISIVMLMASDLLAPNSSWLAHLTAARQIVAMRGGMASCMGNLPDSVFILVQFLTIDTMTSTTCNSTRLPKGSFSELIGDVQDIDFQLIACASTCPAEILKIIARTSALRRQQLDNVEVLYQTEGIVKNSEYDALIGDLDDFSCTSWASRMAHLQLAYPIYVARMAPCSSVDSLASAAECFRSAARVYLLLSCTLDIDESILDQVRLVSATLRRELDHLFGQASEDWNQPLYAQLWKFLTWPLFIVAYAWVGWDITTGEDADLQTLFGRLNNIARVKGHWARANAEQHMREVQARRSKRPHNRWTWDMGFSERRSFVL